MTTIKPEKMYEVEIERTNISPKQFFSYCKRELKKRADIDLEGWVEEYSTWENGSDFEVKEPDETCKEKPFNFHYYNYNGYNFIMLFDFYEENNGFGYMYAMEFVR